MYNFKNTVSYKQFIKFYKRQSRVFRYIIIMGKKSK